MASTFSESWYQVAELRLALLPSVRVHKQLYRGQVWYVLQDACSGKFFRLPATAYAFAAKLTVQKTLEEVWVEFIESHPQEAPGQEEVIHLLSQLHHSNLLFFRSDADQHAILKRFESQERKEHLAKWMAIMYFRLPLWNPNDFLKAFGFLLTPLMGFPAFLVWLFVGFWGGKAVVENWNSLWAQGQGILASDNLPLLYLSMFVLKFFHEMGHAIAVKRFGGDVHTLGIMFIVFTPLPYVDASASWSMRSRWQRMMVGAAGMYVELFFAALAAIIWASTAPGLVNSLAFNVMVIGSVSSLLFNGNPLLKFDAYYILSDFLDLPNLYQRSSQQWLGYFNKWILGTAKVDLPAVNASETFWYSFYGFSSYFYRLFVMIFIIVYVADLWIGLGVLMLIMALMIWVFIPLYKLVHYLTTSAQLHKSRGRAWLGATSALSLLALAILALPLPYSIKAPGVIEPRANSQIYAQSGGMLVEYAVKPGDWLQAGQLIARLSHGELQQELEILRHQQSETQWLLRQATESSQADSQPLQERLAALATKQTEIQRRLADLEIHAPHAGYWQDEGLHEYLGVVLRQGDTLGQVVSSENLRFVAVVSQEKAAELFNRPLDQAWLKLTGQSQITLPLADVQLVPYRQTLLPSLALGWEGGGPVMTSRDAQGQTVAAEPFFKVMGQLPPPEQGVRFYPGMTGWLKLDLPWQPLYYQVQEMFLQLIQKRYQI